MSDFIAGPFVSRTLRASGWFFLGILPLCYRHVPGLPPFLKAVPLLASGAAFGMAVLAERPAFRPSARRAGAWAALWLAWQALSALWGAPFRWTALWPVLTQAAALGIGAGIASDPRRRRGLALALAGAGAALAAYALNLLSGGAVERLLGPALEGLPIDHLPFGNRNLAALLLSALLPLAVLRRSWIPAAFLGCLLWETNGLGAFLGLMGGGALAWILGDAGRRRLLLPLGLAAALLALALGRTLAQRPPPEWRLTTTAGLRSLGWEAAIRGWRASPWIGHGAGSFPLREREFRDDLYPRSEQYAPRMLHPYNLPLLALFETGLPGLALALGALAGCLSSRNPAARWTSGTLVVQALGGDALLDPIGLAAFAVAAGWGLGDPVPAMPRRSPWLVAGIAGALILVSAQVSQVLWFAEGRDREIRRDFAGAEAAYARAAGAGLPSLLSMDARYQRGQSLRADGRFREALAAYRDLMGRAGPYGNARKMGIRAALASGETALALSWLDAELREDPGDAEALDLKAWILGRDQERPGAFRGSTRGGLP